VSLKKGLGCSPHGSECIIKTRCKSGISPVDVVKHSMNHWMVPFVSFEMVEKPRRGVELAS